MKEISVRSKEKCEMIDITREISRVIQSEGLKSGIVRVFMPHTTAGITINENADPDVCRDVLMKLSKLVDNDGDYRHAEGNSAAHIKAVMTGFSVNVFIEDSKLALGTWQGIYLCEFDGPRNRRVWIDMIEK